MSIRARLRSLPCRLGFRPHDWDFWSRLQDGRTVLIVERCSRQPYCRAVRSFPYEPIIPDWFIGPIIDQLRRPNPYRTLFGG